MIGVHRTTHPTEGFGVIIRFRRVNGQISILGITDNAGKDIWGTFNSAQFAAFKTEIKNDAH